MNNLSTAARFILLAAAFVIVVAGLKAAEPLLVPFLLSVFIALICSPLLGWLKSRRVPSGLAILLIVLGVVCLGIIVGAVVGSSIRDFRADLPEYQARLQIMSSGVQQWLTNIGIDLDPVLWQQSFNPGVAMQLVGNMLASFGSVMTNAFLILITVIFIFAEEVGFREKLLNARGAGEHSMGGLESFSNSVNRYLAIKTLLSLATGLLVLLVLWIQGVDYPVMWALLAFLLNFVPTVGSFLAAIPAVLLALIQLGPGQAGFLALAYVAINLVIGNVVEPRWMGKDLNLSPLVVFLSLVFWGWVLGPVGMLLSIPLTILVKIALESDTETAWVGIMLGSGKAQLRVEKQQEGEG
ncbi:MAG: AI-2E family transporter [Gammaproteobacteria bacterium]|nr:AI-2E family transporter [Gammaproteobacteria bacterium]MBQ0838972.1 AI-2E family transporter [Gammaproteobacteria bacterium]